MGRDVSDEESESGLGEQLLTLPTILRVIAFVLVIGGFVGAIETDVSPIAGDSAFSVAFYLGIGCAVFSIYLGIFRHDPGEGQ